MEISRSEDTCFGRFTLTEEDGFLIRVTVGGCKEGDSPLLREGFRQLDAFFRGKRRCFDLPLHPTGTAFQLRVWEQMARISYGETLTYGQLAKAVGCPGGARAVGSACGKNPLPFFIPCHRVIAGNGIGGYSLEGGRELKLRLLDLEKNNR